VEGSESYTSSLGGVLLGVDHDLDDQTRAGLAAGYSDSSLGMGGSHSRATVDSYHLGAYVRHDMGQLRLSLGASHSWHRAEVRRDLAYGEVSGRQRARIDARSQQVFAEAAYRLALPAVQLEPFANLTYQHLDRDGFHEKGDAAALHAGDEQRDAWLSTLGLRGRQQWQIGPQQDLQLAASLGWQHRLSGTQDREHLAFAGSDLPFRVETAPALRDAALVGLQARVGLTRDLDLSLDYQGRLASREQQHGAGLNLQWRF
jgi:subtilase-type serine protease